MPVMELPQAGHDMEYTQGELVPYSEDDQWLRALAGWLAGKAKETRRAYLRIYRDAFLFFNTAPDGVTPDLVTYWLAHLGDLRRAPATVLQRQRGLRSYFDYLVRTGLLESNPARAVQPVPAEVPAGGQPLTMDQVLTLVDTFFGGVSASL